jgi:hypothetical protein
MLVTTFGVPVEATLATALEREGFELRDAPAPGATGDGVVAELAAALRGAEATLEADPPACALACGSGDVSLAGALGAVKLGIPCAWVEPPDPDAEARIVGRIADLTVRARADAPEAALAIAGIAAPTLPER